MDNFMQIILQCTNLLFLIFYASLPIIFNVGKYRKNLFWKRNPAMQFMYFCYIYIYTKELLPYIISKLSI